MELNNRSNSFWRRTTGKGNNTRQQGSYMGRMLEMQEQAQLSEVRAETESGHSCSYFSEMLKLRNDDQHRHQSFDELKAGKDAVQQMSPCSALTRPSMTASTNRSTVSVVPKEIESMFKSLNDILSKDRAQLEQERTSLGKKSGCALFSIAEEKREAVSHDYEPESFNFLKLHTEEQTIGSSRIVEIDETVSSSSDNQADLKYGQEWQPQCQGDLESVYSIDDESEGCVEYEKSKSVLENKLNDKLDMQEKESRRRSRLSSNILQIMNFDTEELSQLLSSPRGSVERSDSSSRSESSSLDDESDASSSFERNEELPHAHLKKVRTQVFNSSFSECADDEAHLSEFPPITAQENIMRRSIQFYDSIVDTISLCQITECDDESCASNKSR